MTDPITGRLRLGVIGCGMISEFHLRAWQRIEEVEIVALADIDWNAADRRRQDYAPGATVYGDVQNMLNTEQLDFVDVLSPPAYHAEHCRAALQANVHVICQKPLSDDLPAAVSLVDAFTQAGRLLCVHENHRYRPWFQKIMDLNEQNFFGTIRFARFCQHDPREPGERYKTDSEHGVLLEYGTHLIDMAIALLGEPEAVCGKLSRSNPRVVGESHAHVQFRYPNAAASIDVAWKASGLPQGEVVIIGDRGEAIYEGSMTRADHSRFRLVEGDRTVLDERRSPWDDYRDSFLALQQRFVAAMGGNGRPPQPASEHLRVLRTAFEIYHNHGLHVL